MTHDLTWIALQRTAVFQLEMFLYPGTKNINNNYSFHDQTRKQLIIVCLLNKLRYLAGWISLVLGLASPVLGWCRVASFAFS